MRYLVQPGDRFSQVATRFGLTPTQLLDLNPGVRRGSTLAGAPCVAESDWSSNLVLEVGSHLGGVLGSPVATIPGTNGAHCTAPATYKATSKKCVNPYVASSGLDPVCSVGTWDSASGTCKGDAGTSIPHQTPQQPQQPAGGQQAPQGGPQGAPQAPSGGQVPPNSEPTTLWPTAGLTEPPAPAECPLDARKTGVTAQSYYDPKTKMCVTSDGASIKPACPNGGLFDGSTETCGPAPWKAKEDANNAANQTTSVDSKTGIILGVGVAAIAVTLLALTVSGAPAPKTRRKLPRRKPLP